MNINTLAPVRARLASALTLEFVVAFALAFVVVFALMQAFSGS